VFGVDTFLDVSVSCFFEKNAVYTGGGIFFQKNQNKIKNFKTKSKKVKNGFHHFPLFFIDLIYVFR
jgi:hypothetical protein